MQVLEFLFSSFWVWLGGLIYLALICAGITQFRPFSRGTSDDDDRRMRR